MSTPSYFPELLKIEAHYSGDRDNATNVMFASCTAAAGRTLAQLNLLAGQIASLWGTKIMPHVVNGIALQQITVADWTSATGLTGTNDVDVPGTDGDGPQAAQVCTLVNWETVLRYRGGRARTYFPPMALASMFDNQTWTGAKVDSMQADITSWLSGMNALTLFSQPITMVVYHRGTTQVPQGVDIFEGGVVEPRLATQRRRVRRVGHVK